MKNPCLSQKEIEAPKIYSLIWTGDWSCYQTTVSENGRSPKSTNQDKARTSEEPKKHPVLFLKPFPVVLSDGQTTEWTIVFPHFWT